MPSKKPNPECKVLTKDPTKGKKKPATPKKRKPHYVDNKRFLESIIVYKNKLQRQRKQVQLNRESMNT